MYWTWQCKEATRLSDVHWTKFYQCSEISQLSIWPNMGLGEQQGMKGEESRMELKEKEGKKGISSRLNELRVDLPSSLPRVCIVGTGIFSRL